MEPKFKIGDHVQTNAEWAELYRTVALSGTVHRIIPMARSRHYVYCIDNGYRIHEGYLELIVAREEDNEVVTPIGIEALVCEDIAERQHMGLKKYGVSLQDNPLTQRERLQHAYEEALDLAIYLKNIMEKMNE